MTVSNEASSASTLPPLLPTCNFLRQITEGASRPKDKGLAVRPARRTFSHLSMGSAISGNSRSALMQKREGRGGARGRLLQGC